MPQPQLVSLLLQAAFYLVTAAALIATMRQMLKHLQDALDELKRWAGEINDFRRESERHRGVLDQLLTAVERDEAMLQKVNDALTELRTESRLRFDHIEKNGERTAREMAGMQRALANIAAGNTSITKLEG